MQATGGRDAIDWISLTARISRFLTATLLCKGLTSFTRTYDLVMTSLAAGRHPISLGGCVVTEVFGVAPLPGTAMTATAVTYRDTCHIVLNIDPAAIPDLPTLTAHVRNSLDEIVKWATH